MSYIAIIRLYLVVSDSKIEEREKANIHANQNKISQANFLSSTTLKHKVKFLIFKPKICYKISTTYCSEYSLFEKYEKLATSKQ